jgi:hypothetical protein
MLHPENLEKVRMGSRFRHLRKNDSGRRVVQNGSH